MQSTPAAAGKGLSRVLLRLGAFIAAGAAAGPAHAGGYDTPMLYSARHMGMGGTAIGYVNDPSALFHNPAGLAHVRHAAALADFSLLVGKLRGSPDATASSIDSELTIAPFFLVGGAYRFHERLVAGLGIYPVASSGATYEYGATGFENRTSLLFVEASPAIAIELPANLRVGLGYRVTYVRLQRFSGNTQRDELPFLDFTVSGLNFLGFRAGIQWTPHSAFELGLVYRHVTETEVTNDRGIANRRTYADVATSFTLPSRLGAGARLDLERWGPHLALASDVEYALNAQNEGEPLVGDSLETGVPIRVPNVFEWQNAVTLRVGVEYRLLAHPVTMLDRIALRAGYVFDGKTANERYPTAFGTPPAPTHVGTVGVGYRGEQFQTNLAYAYRFGATTVTESDLSQPGARACQFCGAAGDYEMKLNGIYADVSYDF